YIWRELYSKKSIHIEKFPEAKYNYKLDKITKKLINFNTKIWKTKKERGLTLKDEIKIKIPKELEIFEKDLRKMHNIN
ncbi:MAG: hypothetical protein J7J93_03700, partial [Candidatus Aenigmarchaeota archaeon]|nr:hypothetical protein [Candidatus Aenigmarchaeota archaeon]